MREPVVGDRVRVNFEWWCVLHHYPWHKGAEGEITAVLTTPENLPVQAGQDHPYYVHVDGDIEEITKRYARSELEIISPT